MENIVTILLLSLLIVAFCVAGLAIKVILKKNGRFPQIHIGRNKEMAKRDIHCVHAEDAIARRNYHAVDTSRYTKAKES